MILDPGPAEHVEWGVELQAGALIEADPAIPNGSQTTPPSSSSAALVPIRTLASPHTHSKGGGRQVCPPFCIRVVSGCRVDSPCRCGRRWGY